MIIPPEELSPETLRALCEEFVTRHGAVQGHTEVSTDTMISQILTQLRTGTAFIVFDENDETCSIVTKQDLSRPAPEESVHRRDPEPAEEMHEVEREITTDYTDEHGWEEQDDRGSS